CRQNMSGSNVADVYPVQAGVEVSRHGAIEEIHDHLSGRCGSYIARTHRGAGIYDDDGSALGGELEGETFGFPFGELVMVVHLRFGHWGGFVGGRELSVYDTGKADATHGAGVNDAGTTGAHGGLEDTFGPGDVGGVHRGIILQPDMIAGGNME